MRMIPAVAITLELMKTSSFEVGDVVGGDKVRLGSERSSLAVRSMRTLLEATKSSLSIL